MRLLQAAVDTNAEIIATACPLCQMNLEAYQGKINNLYGRDFSIPVVYFSHLVGAALGIAPKEMGLDKMLIEPVKLCELAKGATE